MGLIAALREFFTNGNSEVASGELRSTSDVPSDRDGGVVEDVEVEGHDNSHQGQFPREAGRSSQEGDHRQRRRDQEGKRSSFSRGPSRERQDAWSRQRRERYGERNEQDAHTLQGAFAEDLDPSEITSQVEAIKDVQEVASEKVTQKSKEFKAIHEDLRSTVSLTPYPPPLAKESQ